VKDPVCGTKPLLDKLGVKPGAKVDVLGVRDESFARDLRARTSDIVLGKVRGDSDIIFVATESKRDLAKLVSVQKKMRRDAAVWVVRPKGVTYLTERDVMAGGKAAGLVDVKIAAFSETHSGMKFVIRLRDR
jgi:hypothetical protein